MYAWYLFFTSKFFVFTHDKISTAQCSKLVSHTDFLRPWLDLSTFMYTLYFAVTLLKNATRQTSRFKIVQKKFILLIMSKLEEV